MAQQSLAAVEVLQSLGKPLVCVVGDAMLDVYTTGTATRISQEAPIPVIRLEDNDWRPGGAANVATMLAALGARVFIAGVIGDDVEGHTLRGLLEEARVDTSGLLVDSSRCTTVKHRFVGRAQQRQPHQLLRVDREIRHPLNAGLRARLVELVRDLSRRAGVILLADYDKGVCKGGVSESIITCGRDEGVPVLADPAPIADFGRYRGADLITPNRNEAQNASGQVIFNASDALRIGQTLCQKLSLDAAIVTLDKDGMALTYPRSPGRIFPTRPRQVCDVTGAGDMVLAVLGLCRACDVPLDRGIELANAAAGLEVERFGATPLSRQELLRELTRNEGDSTCKIVSREELLRRVAMRRRMGHRIAFTNGCFDLLHQGHIALLEQGVRLGECLVVAVNSDGSVQQLKGPGRPILSQNERAAMVAALGCVHYVTVFDDLDPCALLQSIKPDVLFKGGDYEVEEVVGRELVEGYGGRVCLLPSVPNASSTRLIERIRTPTTPLGRNGFSQPVRRDDAED
jgi:D-beta-D-heptose 7-phosphate kinase/D-beta-D-heptose 1-phosphate adenosyltransferase